MPKDNQNTNSNSPSAMPNIPPQSDLPPLPPDFQNYIPSQMINTSPFQPSTPPPPFAPPPPTHAKIASLPKKKFGGGRVIATILGIFLLVGAVSAGVILTGQKQLFQQKAKVTMCPDDEACPYPRDRKLLLSCHPVDNDGTTTDSLCSWVGRVETCGSAWTEYCCPAAGGFWITDMTACTTPRPTPTRTPTPRPTRTPTPTPTRTPTPRPTPTRTPTPTPTPSPRPPQCISVKAYSVSPNDSSWTLLTADQLKALKTGATINFCVAGSTVSGTFDKAQFKINTTLKPITTVKRPGSNDYCQSYKILSTDKTVSVKAKIHHATLGWFGEPI